MNIETKIALAVGAVLLVLWWKRAAAAEAPDTSANKPWKFGDPLPGADERSSGGENFGGPPSTDGPTMKSTLPGDGTTSGGGLQAALPNGPPGGGGIIAHEGGAILFQYDNGERQWLGGGDYNPRGPRFRPEGIRTPPAPVPPPALPGQGDTPPANTFV
jgi:hypothetical protein